MSDLDHSTVELHDRPEPHFPEGAHWPRAGWRSAFLWGLLVVMLVVGLLAGFWTDMAVDRKVDGSVVSVEGAGLAVQVVLIDRSPSGQGITVGLPVRLHIGDDSGWGVVTGVREYRGLQEQPHRIYRRARVAIVGPESLFFVVPGQACAAHVLVGFTPTLHGLWQLGTGRRPEVVRRDQAELHRRIPEVFRETVAYRRIEQFIEQMNSYNRAPVSSRQGND